MKIRLDKYEVENFLKGVISKNFIDGKEVINIRLDYNGELEIEFIDKLEEAKQDTDEQPERRRGAE